MIYPHPIREKFIPPQPKRSLDILIEDLLCQQAELVTMIPALSAHMAAMQTIMCEILKELRKRNS